MEDVKQYGDLENKELLEFLNEIKSDDEDIQEAKIEADKKIALDEEFLNTPELPENNEIEAYYGDKAWCISEKKAVLLCENQHKINMASTTAIKQRTQRLKNERIRIQRQAFNQNYIHLNDTIEKENIKLLISLLVKEHAAMAHKYEAFINRRLTILLNPFIPKKLRTCKALYPDSVRVCSGFLYRASKEFGRGLTFWAMPDIPYYFAQGTEQKILIEHKPEFLISIDKAVSSYHDYRNKMTRKELKCASTIIQKGIRTYFDLLKLNPFWFEILYNNLVNNNEHE